MKCVIIAHGSLEGSEVLKKECSDSDYVICADGGAEYAFMNNISPNLILGDLDSIDEKVLKYYSERGTRIDRYPREKDYTDTEICIKRAEELGAKEICIIAGVGGRIDHSLGNIFLLSLIADRGIKGYIASNEEYVYFCKNEVSIRGRVGDIISIIPLRSDAKGLNTKGLKYKLEDGEISFARTLGISNEMEEEECSIKIGTGEILVIKTAN
jgi:thiamine pyrophosphokinase